MSSSENNDRHSPNSDNEALESLLCLLSRLMDKEPSFCNAYGLEVAEWVESYVPGCGVPDRLLDRTERMLGEPTERTTLEQKMQEIVEEDLSEAKIRSIITIMQDILTALKSLEDKGFLHGYIEPRHIFLGRDGAWKIGFPSCRPPKIDPQDRRIFKNVKLGGKSSAYMPPEMEGPYIYKAPEFINGEDGSKTMDVYSAGVILCELITGCRPETVVSKDGFFELAKDTFKKLSSGDELSGAKLAKRCQVTLLCKLCETMLSGDPDKRISATDALSELDRLADVSWPIVVDSQSEE